MDSSSGFNVLDKKTTSLNSDFLRWMKRQQSTSGTEPKISIMAAHHQLINPDHPFFGDDAATAGGRAVDPTNNSGGANEAAGSIYHDQVSSCDTPYKSTAGGLGMGRGFPFTGAQWKELERQAMIYKCMISSVPVPPHLLFPLDSSFPSYGGRYSRKGDPEPGRCKRTDGKKWRCSREVAPQQKYCERHLHRGRPRSRKPVEVNNKKTRLQQTKTPPTPPNQPKTHLTISTPNNRDLGVMIGGEIASSKQPWENLIEADMGMANHALSDYTSSFDQNYALHHHHHHHQPLNLFSYPEMDLPAGFIDAWSIDNLNNRNNVTVEPLSEGDLSPSLNLSMTMAVGNVLDEQMRSIQCKNDDDFDTTKDSIWLSPVSWEPFARGGPLGEALQPGSVAVACSNPPSPYNSLSTPATTVSSPSGVLHRTLFSHSDGSVCNSPTFAAAPTENSNQWHI